MPSSGGDKLCPICDSPLQPGSKKCGFCGTDLSIFDIEVEAPKPVPTPVTSQPPRPSVESRIEEIFSKPLVPERPAPAPARAPEPPARMEPKPEPKPRPVVEIPEKKPAVAEELEESIEYFECPQCGTLVETTATSCPKCGVLFAEEGAEMFQCPACNTLVNIDAKSCPGCGAIFIEPEAAEVPAPRMEAPPVKKDLEAPVAEVKAPPKPKPAPAPAPQKEEEKKGLFGMFRRGKKEEPEAAPKIKPTKAPAPAGTQPAPPPSPPERPAGVPPSEVRPREEAAPTAVPSATKDKGSVLARMVAEMKPLLSLAREKDVDITDAKALIDEAAIAGRERQLDKAIVLVQKSKAVMMSKMDSQLADEILHLNDEIKVAREFGGDISRPATYVQEIARARSSGDVEAAYVYVDKVKKELLPITGRYNESKRKLVVLKQLIADAEAFIVDTKEARGLLVDASKALDAKDFDRLDSLTKGAQEKLYLAIPNRMNDEMRKAKDELLEAKMRNVNITPLITLLKSATNLMKAGDYAQALKEMREFKNMMKKSS